jgi:hypothetical protein
VPAPRFFAARFSARFSHSGSVFSLCVLPRCSGLQITASDGPWLSPLQKIGVVPDALLLPSFGPKQIESTDADENGSRVYLFRNPATARKMDAIGLCPDTGPETRETGGARCAGRFATSPRGDARARHGVLQEHVCDLG